MSLKPNKILSVSAVGLAVTLALAGCGANSKSGAETATKVACEVDQPDEPGPHRVDGGRIAHVGERVGGVAAVRLDLGDHGRGSGLV